jgi:hypothetical protein
MAEGPDRNNLEGAFAGLERPAKRTEALSEKHIETVLDTHAMPSISELTLPQKAEDRLPKNSAD